MNPDCAARGDAIDLAAAGVAPPDRDFAVPVVREADVATINPLLIA